MKARKPELKYDKRDIRAVSRLVRKLIAMNNDWTAEDRRKMVEAELRRMDTSRPVSEGLVKEVLREIDEPPSGLIPVYTPGQTDGDGDAVADPKAMPGRFGMLSERRREVLALLLKGHSEKQIAEDLSISPHTVHDHVKTLYRELGVGSRSQLVAKYLTEVSGDI